MSDSDPIAEDDDQAPAAGHPDAWLWMTPKGRRRPKPEDLVDVLRSIASGTSMHAICGALGLDVPSTHHALQQPAYRQHYKRAMEIRATILGEEALELGRAVGRPGSKVKPDGARVAIDTIKWFNGKVAPKIFGDKIAHVGADEDEAPIRHQVDLSKLSDADLTALEQVGRALGLSGPAVPDRGREGAEEG